MSHQQTLYPDQITAEANYFPRTTEPSAIDDDPEAPDGLWGQWDGNGNTVLGMGFPTPSSPPLRRSSPKPPWRYAIAQRTGGKHYCRV